MELPTFDGIRTEWLPFYQSFCNTVDKAPLPRYMKLTLLNRHVTGQALEIIKWYALTDDIYQPALQALKDVY